MEPISFEPIGVIKSPFAKQENIPIQSSFGKEYEAWCELKPAYMDGLKGLDEFSHAILIYYFHKADFKQLITKPYLENEKHGVFAIRTPHRPNKIGLSIVKIKKIVANKIYFTEVDMLDNTPLLDIKPYVKHFDQREHSRSGWVEKHFSDGNIPEQTILNKK